jgi:hypothetical protein
MKHEYDEQRVLAFYMWDHFPSLFTQIERKAYRAVFAERKREAGHVRFADGIWLKFKLADDPAVMEALSDGAETFFHRATRRAHKKISTRFL